ncbi:hypothetical protein B0H67DRAFT_659339 [Lasiosphaeris hirsuta]|uniref:DUF7924 domain-containing protein n=1 Tax=Lasiosphaeris hirsuta TaxID=260670 RepID=A0AA40B148_9PEZI|nr:hypothetical protein B0H67DRAFT_659339 [Lasiosphaeris hirsuta]
MSQIPQGPLALGQQNQGQGRLPIEDMTDVRSPAYRSGCLRHNGVCFEHPSNQLPSAVIIQTGQIFAPRPTPTTGVMATMMYDLDTLSTLGCVESEVVHCFSQGHLFPTTLPSALYHYTDVNIGRHLLPSKPNAPCAIPQPRPNLIYGYPIHSAFTKTQRTTLDNLHPEISSYSQIQPDSKLCFPFFIVEFKAAGGTGGDLWVAANQCAGGSVACLLALEQLNLVVREKRTFREIPNFCYSLAIDNHFGQLYASWKDGDYHIERVAAFSLSEPEHVRRLYYCIHGILEWGVIRQGDIRTALNSI